MDLESPGMVLLVISYYYAWKTCWTGNTLIIPNNLWLLDTYKPFFKANSGWLSGSGSEFISENQLKSQLVKDSKKKLCSNGWNLQIILRLLRKGRLKKNWKIPNTKRLYPWVSCDFVGSGYKVPCPNGTKLLWILFSSRFLEGNSPTKHFVRQRIWMMRRWEWMGKDTVGFVNLRDVMNTPYISSCTSISSCVTLHQWRIAEFLATLKCINHIFPGLDCSGFPNRHGEHLTSNPSCALAWPPWHPKESASEFADQHVQW